jgi:hypothetical protein
MKKDLMVNELWLLKNTKNIHMKKYLSVLLVLTMFASCFNPFKRTIKGDGNILTAERNLSDFDEVSCAGSYEVAISQGSPSSVKIEADENILPFIVTDVDGDELKIHSKDDVNLSPTKKIKLIIVTDKLEGFSLSGSGSVTGGNKFTGGDRLDLDISGSGNMHFDVNTPSIKSSISGTGDIYLSGETRNSKINIAGSGDYHAENLKSEMVKVEIAGSGNAYLFADSTLDIDIAGVGNVNYKGGASVTQSIAGSGKIKKMD